MGDKTEKYKDVFAFFDKTGNGSISTKDLGTAMRALDLDPTEEELRSLISDVDSDRNGTVDLDDFLRIMSKYSAPKKETESDLLEAFKVFDKNESGLISADELKHVLTNLGEKLTDEELQELFFEAGLEMGKEIKYGELIKTILQS